nr:hypothetical protein CQW23_34938 [Ipomoea trifida]GLL16991.1 hypothetical protein CQW23_34938 [Ipomoea trifida]GLL25348.1 hypothetical protein CQW23_34938 [Ipomoea trifida]GLL25350.1 hypothetical protein CQW23_34938 [Ipomoea trifida]GLL25353.1 hypothetical protein CQW23_34938 [Ipomoea trifida]
MNSEFALSTNKEAISNATMNLMESSILAQDERWRHASHMQVGREVVFPVADGHGPDSYGRQQWGIFRNGRKPDGAMPRGAAAVIQRMQALSGMIGRKASVGGFLSPPSNPRAQPWTGGGNYQAGVRLPVISRRKVRMTSSHHAPYALGDTRATMAGTKGRDPARVRRFTSRARSLVQVQDGPAAPGKRIEEVSDYFMHAPLGSGDIAQLVELRSCNWVVAITGWMSNCPGGNDSILYLNRWLTFSKSSMDRTWTVVGVGGSPRVPPSEISGEEDQVGPCEQLDALSPFNPLSEMRQKKRKENPWTDPIISTP